MYAAVGFILVHSHSAGVSNAFFIYFFGVGFFAFFYASFLNAGVCLLQ